MDEMKCMYCGCKRIENRPNPSTCTLWVVCPNCGSFVTTMDYCQKNKIGKDMVAAYLYHNVGVRKDELSKYYACFLGTEDEYEDVKDDYINLHFISPEEIRAYYPRMFSERVDKVLLALARKSEYFGKTISVSEEEMVSLLFLKRINNGNDKQNDKRIKKQEAEILDYLTQSGYIESMEKTLGADIKLKAEGWKAIEQLQSQDNYNRNVFVAMSFDKSLYPIRDAIKKGTIGASFSAKFMDETIHNQEIVPEMFRLIRASRFLIMDISEPNYGAYYEAGYARGLGKEIIITCRKDIYEKKYTTDEEIKYEKYLKPHFDIAQKQILIWKDYADLAEKLKQWILALFS